MSLILSQKTLLESFFLFKYKLFPEVYPKRIAPSATATALLASWVSGYITLVACPASAHNSTKQLFKKLTFFFLLYTIHLLCCGRSSNKTKDAANEWTWANRRELPSNGLDWLVPQRRVTGKMESIFRSQNVILSFHDPDLLRMFVSSLLRPPFSFFLWTVLNEWISGLNAFLLIYFSNMNNTKDKLVFVHFCTICQINFWSAP